MFTCPAQPCHTLPLFVMLDDHPDFAIPYECSQLARSYLPDFLVSLVYGSTLVLEIKGAGAGGES